MRYFVRTTAIALGILLSGSLTAAADPVFYSFVTSNTPYGVITTALPSSPTPVSSTADSFRVDATLVIDGDPTTLPVDFFAAAAGGGAEADGMHFGGPVLFSGPTANPTFLTGTFNLGDFTVTVSPSPSAAALSLPEPATLVLFGTGALICCWFAKRFLSTHDPSRRRQN
jgi:hypothetical protein